jgi:hypothetical protein
MSSGAPVDPAGDGPRPKDSSSSSAEDSSAARPAPDPSPTPGRAPDAPTSRPIVRPDTRGGVALGLILIGLGVLFLVERVADVDLGRFGWPLFVIVPGLLILAWGVTAGGREGAGIAAGGGITTMVGLILAVQNATGLWATWAYAWALVGPGGTGLGLIVYGLFRGDRTQLWNGLRSLAAGLVLFAAFGLFFEGVIGLSGRPFLTGDALPFALIALGVVVLGAAVLRGRAEPE